MMVPGNDVSLPGDGAVELSAWVDGGFRPEAAYLCAWFCTPFLGICDSLICDLDGLARIQPRVIGTRSVPRTNASGIALSLVELPRTLDHQRSGGLPHQILSLLLQVVLLVFQGLAKCLSLLVAVTAHRILRNNRNRWDGLGTVGLYKSLYFK